MVSVVDHDFIGEVDRGNVLVLLHGFLGSGADWRQVLPGLQHHYRCVTVDLPGHGESSNSNIPESPEQLAEQVVRALAHCGIDRFSLLGYSLGGRLALVIAASYPDQIEELFLEGANPGLQSETERNRRLLHDEHWACRFYHEPLSRVLDDWYQQPVFASLDKFTRATLVQERIVGDNGQNRSRQLAKLLRCCSLAHQKDYRGFLQNYCTSKQGAQHKTKVIYLAGEYDQKFRQLAQSLAQECGVDVRIIAAAGHNTHRDNPAGFVDTLLSFGKSVF